MLQIGILNHFPLGVTATVLVVVLLTCVEVGYRLGKAQHQRNQNDGNTVGKDFVQGSMFALLGLVMAFTYAFTVSRANMRQHALIDEANAIGTAFLRADLAPDPYSSELKQLLLEYAKTRVFTTANITNQTVLNKTISRTLDAQDKLWPAIVNIVDETKVGPKEIAIVQAVNNVLDMHVTRLRGAYDRLPGIALLMLIFIAAASLAVAGYNAGLSGTMNRGRISTFTLILAAVLLIIIDFDIPQRGLIGVHQGAMVELIKNMEASVSTPD